MRTLAAVPSLVALFFVPSAQAIGLGSIQLQSALGQPLNAQIPIHLGSTAVPTQDITVKLLKRARDDDEPTRNSRNAEVDYRARIVQLGDGKPGIRITSSNALDTPYVRFTVNVKTPKGQLSREYTLLLDPPEFADLSSQSSANTLVSTPSKQAPRKRSPATATRARVRSDASTASAMQAVVAKQPYQQQLQVTGNGLSARVKPLSDNVYGPTRANETLWSIVNTVPKPEGVTTAQFELAIVQANPDAFIAGNVNGLRADQMLQIPTKAQIQAFGVSDEQAKLAAQDSEWASLHEEIETAVAAGMNALRAKANALASGTPTTQVTPVKANTSAPPLIQLAAADAPQTPSAHDSVAVNKKSVSDASPSGQDRLPVGKTLAADNNKEYVALLSSMQRAINGSAQRLDALQSSQTQMLTKTQALTDDHAALKATFDAKMQELTRIEQQLQRVNQQLALLDPSGAVTTHINGQTPTLAEASAQRAGMNTATLLGMGLVAGGLLGGLWFIRRRQWTVIGDDDTSLEYEHVDIAQENTEAANDVTPVASLAVETAVDESEDESAAQHSLTPLDEADVYITHQRFEQAEAILSDAIKQQPKCLEYYEKLLEVHAAADNDQAFESTAAYMTNDLSFNDTDTQAMINTLRALTWPDKHHGNDATGAKADEADEVQTAQFVPPLADTGEHKREASASAQTFTASVEAKTQHNDEAFTSKDTVDDDKLSFSAQAAAIAPVHAAAAEAMTVDDDDRLHFTTDESLTVQTEGSAAPDAITQEGIEAPSAALAEDTADDPATALDLARAYIDLQDIESAVALLHKVEVTGNPDERAAATELMQKIS